MDRRTLIDNRIKTLLKSTDLTFKQIIEQLRSENMPASFNTIRRVNRNHLYRKPRYDAKLTPQQRRELIIKLKNTTKPNLSSLARQYGVCHGSIWYWWDKLSKIREKNGGIIPHNEPSLEFDDIIVDQDFGYEGNGSGPEHPSGDIDDDYLNDPDSDPLSLDEDEAINFNSNMGNNDVNNDAEDERHIVDNLEDVELVGPVQVKNLNGEYVKLPILMYAPVSSSTIWNLSSPTSSRREHCSLSSTPTTSTGQSSSGSLSSQIKISLNT